jgi:CheY-like chemotaxis protein
LISLLSYPLNFSCQPEIQLRYGAQGQQAVIHIQAWICDPWSWEDEQSQADMLQAAHFWGQQIGATITVRHPQEGQTGEIVLEMNLPLAEQPAILVVDDQKPTQQMFQRFLSRKPYQVIGITEPEQVLSMARQLQPALITLDVMMPKVDGWEILQALQADEQTRTIPVLVCSAWEEPELAKSLGAAAFLKKPVRQQELLEALEGLGL